jgi:hypothetical protein
MRWKTDVLESETRTQSTREVQRSPFSQQVFLQHLLNFIIADDQVGKVRFQCLL